MRFRRLLFVLMVAVVAAPSSFGWGQVPSEKVDLETINKIKEEGLKRSKVMETVSFLTDVHGPRLTAAPLTRQAGEWTKGKLTEWGLQGARLESWGPFGRGWSLEGFHANMVAPNFSPLIAYPKAWSPSTPKAIRGEPIVLEATTEAELEKYRGKLHRAIVMLGGPREVKAQFDPPGRRHTDESLLSLANSGPTPPLMPSTPAAPNSSPNSKQATPPSGEKPTAEPAKPNTPPSPAQPPRGDLQLNTKKWQLLYDEGVALVIEPGRGDGGTVFAGMAATPKSASLPSGGGFRSRPMPWAKDCPEIIPQVVMAVEHYNRIVRMLQKGSHVQLDIDIASRYHEDDLMSFNVLAEIPGTDLKDEVVMLGAHFDSWHPGTGATDNAAGCAVALEAVRILQAVGVKPRRTIRIGLWTGEEQGLLGSRAYVDANLGRTVSTPPSANEGGAKTDSKPSAASDAKPETKPETKPEAKSEASNNAAQPPERERRGRREGRGGPAEKFELKPEHAKFAGYFNLDNGTGKIRGVYLQGNESMRPIFRAWLAPFADMGASTITTSSTGGTDHLSFDRIGLPGFQFIQDPVEYNSRTHHSSMDVYERIQEDDVKQASIIMAAFVYLTAMRDEKLPRKPLNGEVVAPTPAK